MTKNIIEKIFGSPAVILDRAVNSAVKVTSKVRVVEKPFEKAKSYWHSLGPGLTTGASDDDPSGIATYSQTGAKYGTQFLWLAIFTFPLASIVQEMCGRIGMVTGRGLAGNINRHYPRWILYASTILLFSANTLNIGADLGAMAKGVQLLAPGLSFTLLVIAFTIIMLLLQIFSSYRKYSKFLKYMALVLLFYILSTLIIPNLDWKEIIKAGFVPSMNFTKDEIVLVCAILGTTISPYLFFWQTSQEVEEQILDGKTTIAQREVSTDNESLKSMRIDVWSGMFLSEVVMFFIITATAMTLHINGITNIQTSADAARALRPLAGNSAYLLFAVGIIGTGLLAVPVLAGSTSYAISESFGWKQGLYRKLNEAYSFYGVIILSMLVGLSINFIGIDPIKALIYSAVANGLVAPIVLYFIVSMSSNKKIMGDKTNHWGITFFGWLITIIMAVAGLATIWALFG